MNTGQALGFVGAVIGGIYGGAGGAQLGYAIGSAIGYAIDPLQVQGPKIGDAQTQTSMEGVPRPVIYGFATCAGNIIQRSELDIRERKDTAKGTTTETVSDECFMTYAIRICEGTSDGVLIRRVWRNEKLVIDRTGTGDLDADTSAFLSKARFYGGTETQMPDPDLEAIVGVGNQPAYRGTAYMVVVDDNLTSTGGTVPQYRFEVVSEGTAVDTTVTEYIQPPLGRFQNQVWPLADAESNYEFHGYLATQGGPFIPVLEYVGESTQDVINYFTNYDYSMDGGGSRAPNHYLGYSAETDVIVLPGIGLKIDDYGVSNAVEQPDVTDNLAVVLVYNDFIPNGVHPYLNTGTEFCGIPGGWWEQDLRGAVTSSFAVSPGGQVPMTDTCSGNDLYTSYALYIRVTRKAVTDGGILGDPCELERPVLIPDAPDYRVDCDSQITVQPTYSTVTGTFKQMALEEIVSDGGRLVYSRYPQGPVLEPADPDYNNSAYWIAAYNSAVAAGDLPAGWVYGVDYPQVVSSAIGSETTTTMVTPGAVYLHEIVSDICERVELDPGDIDVTELVDEVKGYILAKQIPAAEYIRPLQSVYFFDAPEFDQKIRFRKRGGDIDFEVDDADFVEFTNDDDDTREQAIEVPAKWNLIYADPAANSSTVKQTAARRSRNVVANNEVTLEVPITMDQDSAAQVVEKVMRIAYAQAEDEKLCKLPMQYTSAVPSDVVRYQDRRYLIVEKNDADGVMQMKMVRDRLAAYASSAQGQTPTTPSSPYSSLKGPTRFEFLNLPPLTDADDRVGFYVGVCGILPGWAGVTLRATLTPDSVSPSWVTLLETTTEAVMGYTETAMDSGSPWVYDPTTEVVVAVHGGSLSSVEVVDLLNEANACVIGDEVMQFEDAFDMGNRRYQLTGVTRARLNSTATIHPIHSRFVLLSRVKFVEIPSGWIGRTITFQPISAGTPVANNYTEIHPWTPATIQVEWPPFHFTGTRDGSDNLSMAWIGRGRMGSTSNPYHSVNFIGYQLSFNDGIQTVTKTTLETSYDYSAAEQTADFGYLPTGPITINIYAMNRITGASEPLTGSL